MKKIILISTILLGSILPLFAAHIKGGEIFYTYLGPGSAPDSDRFRITLRLFISCASQGGQLDGTVNIGIFRNRDNSKTIGSPYTLPLTSDQFINLTTPSPCIVNPSAVCYRVRTYSIDVELAKEPLGYTAVFQRCCRIDGIENLNPNVNIGSTYSCRIHGSSDINASQVNSSPSFFVKDTVLICQNRRFTLDFGAFDQDGDSLSYSFCDAHSAPSNPPVVPDPAPPNSIFGVQYASGFSGTQPLGPLVTINPRSGLISGTAPRGGDYVVCVCLKEWRNGKVISEHRKDFNIQIDERCDLAAAELKPSYITCDGFDFSFHNEAPISPLIHAWNWDFGVPNTDTDTSSLERPTFLYPDTGTYTVKLIINPGEECSDSATTTLKVYPGFFAGFAVNGSCKLIPFQFSDTTKARYGAASVWSWNFGDETTTADTSTAKNPRWLYSTVGTKRVQMIVQSNKGCIDTVFKDVEVKDKPTITLPFRDTLICSVDTLQLLANGTGIFSWTPNSNIINAGTPNPLVYPKNTTTYLVTLNESGCVNTDSIRVRVVDFVSLSAGNDTTICSTDTIQLKPFSDGLQYSWSPSTYLNNAFIKNPFSNPGNTITYTCLASIGKCSATDDIVIRTIPYPGAFAGNDTTVCFDDTASLSGSIAGSSFNWTPANTLSNPNNLSTFAFPKRSTLYTLKAFDTLGCPKPGISSVLVTVRARVNAFAGKDTAIVVGQPLRFNASGAEFFHWFPPTGLNRTDISNPVATLQNNMTYYMRAYTAEGCFAIDTINVRVFKTNPDIFVPNAFRPRGSKNNVLRPIPVGISKIDYFRVYNRWGQLVFQTTEAGKGWDGTISGKSQDSGTYVWMVSGKDFTGKTVTRRGTAILIR